jgi:hypothetical protein
MKRFFLFCSGANAGVLKGCPTEESKYVAIGATILLTAIFASFSGGFALFTVFRSIPPAIVFGMLWGVVIFNLDRVIVMGMRKQNNFALDLLYVAPRLAIALLLAVVISRPLELKLFEVEIRDRWQQMDTDARSRDVVRIRGNEAARLAELRTKNDRLQKEIDDLQDTIDVRTEAAIVEGAGLGGTGIPGIGVIYRQRDQFRQAAQARLDEVRARNDSVIRWNNAEIARLVANQDSMIARADRVRDGSYGFLARMTAFGVLKHENRTIHWASLFITLLFISVETAPVVVKLLSTLNPYRPYDDLLEQYEIEVVERARARRHELKADASRKIFDYEKVVATERRLSEDRNQLRADAEGRTSEVLFNRIADAQAEIGTRLVESWKYEELAKIGRGPEAGIHANGGGTARDGARSG